MKKVIIAISMFSACASLAQTNWTFRWHGQEQGIIFLTNLTDSVKAAIRDDIALVMANIAVSNATTIAVARNDEELGMIDGVMNFDDGRYTRPDDFPIGYYREVNGTTNFLLSADECSVYAVAIALTNQYAAQISQLPAVILAFTNGFDVANMTLEQKGAYFWHPYLDKQKVEDVAGYEATITEALPESPATATVLNPSVLSYHKVDVEDNGNLLLACKVVSAKDGAASGALTFVYRNGAWRLCPEIF